MSDGPDGRVLWAGLDLLDHQLVDRDGRAAGNVDDLELSEPDERGQVHITAILAGPGVILQRQGHHRLGGWIEQVLASVDGARLRRIPMARVTEVGAKIHVAADADQLATAATEQWWLDHLIAKIPGSRRASG